MNFIFFKNDQPNMYLVFSFRKQKKESENNMTQEIL